MALQFGKTHQHSKLVIAPPHSDMRQGRVPVRRTRRCFVERTVQDPKFMSTTASCQLSPPVSGNVVSASNSTSPPFATLKTISAANAFAIDSEYFSKQQGYMSSGRGKSCSWLPRWVLLMLSTFLPLCATDWAARRSDRLKCACVKHFDADARFDEAIFPVASAWNGVCLQQKILLPQAKEALLRQRSEDDILRRKYCVLPEL